MALRSCHLELTTASNGLTGQQKMDAVDCDPLRRLTYEVWVRCMKFYAHEKPEGVLPLLAVSSSWQSNLLETKELWNTVYLDGGHDELCRAECFFHLSSGLPIELILDKDSHAAEIVIKHRNRISSLVLYIRSLAFGTVTTYKFDVIRLARTLDRHRYPILSHIHVEMPCTLPLVIPPSLIKACPALIGIHGAYIEQETVSILPVSTTNVGVMTSEALPEGLGGRFEVLRVRHHSPQTQEDDSSETQEESPSRCFNAPSILLTSFELYYGHFSNTAVLGDRGNPFGEGLQYLSPLEGFASTTHHGLKVLSIEMPWYEISRLVPVLSTSTALRDLELTVDPARDPPQPNDIPSLTMSDIGHVRKLALYIQEGSGTYRHLFEPNLRRFLRLFVDGNALGLLEWLHLHFIQSDYEGTFNSEVLGLLQVTRNLRELHLMGSDVADSKSDSPKILLNRLHTLVISSGYTAQHLEMPNLACFIDTNPRYGDYHDGQTFYSSTKTAKTLESVTVQASRFYQWNDTISKAQPIGDTFPRLTRLRLFTEFIYQDPLVTPNFSNLQSIIFEDANQHRIFFTRQPLDKFMMEILFSPDICPCLHTIRSTAYPSWVLTVAMLQRRNSLQTVTPIRSLWLPGYPQIFISSLISQVLDTPMKDSSATMDIARRVDKAIDLRWATNFFLLRACRNCIMSGYVACASDRDKPKNTTAPPDDDAITKILDLETVAMSESQFETWDRSQWEAYLKHAKILTGPADPYLKRWCNRHDPKNLVHMGPQTMAGTTYDLF